MGLSPHDVAIFRKSKDGAVIWRRSDHHNLALQALESDHLGRFKLDPTLQRSHTKTGLIVIDS